MKFLLDESVDARLRSFLIALGHDAVRVGTDYPPSLPDEEVLAIAHREGRILITNDRDFGELVFVHGRPHAGVIYLRLPYSDLALAQQRLTDVLTDYGDQLDQFITVTRSRIRIRR
jgi:predicted nuclease of predicted toxin-antitoxin system